MLRLQELRQLQAGYVIGIYAACSRKQPIEGLLLTHVVHHEVHHHEVHVDVIVQLGKQVCACVKLLSSICFVLGQLS